MLVLTRSVDECVVFPELGISIRVLAARSGKIQLGIEAPRDVAVHREEVAERIASGETERRKVG